VRCSVDALCVDHLSLVGGAALRRSLPRLLHTPLATGGALFSYRGGIDTTSGLSLPRPMRVGTNLLTKVRGRGRWLSRRSPHLRTLAGAPLQNTVSCSNLFYLT
jgi:hypothetical protein